MWIAPIIIAVVLIAAIVVVATKRARDSRAQISVGKRVVAAINDDQQVERIVQLGCLIASGKASIVESVCVVEVPLAIAVDGDIGDAATAAAGVLKRANDVAASMGVTHRGTVRKARFAGKVIVDLANERKADVIVLGTQVGDSWSPTADFVFRNAHCEVIVARA